ncbi:MAG: 4a-hydroxytetrahydrobiopterin dehydratase [Gammaproteobacteria bacterium]|jgi:4a-hydroxytetrahydrobiopterin dehydratase|nr:MAG: 4a-hydroxytetrahydrobiopterin dehydratase [Gammaproteobacteria bacterium TMED225]|tara:strand:+ start:889 stop:1230 length:342 start_codon:yes stop_codon:yes gene_type:complete
MNENLLKGSCEACRIDAPKVTNSEIESLMPQIPSWSILENDDIKKLVCSFAFLDYDQTVNFANSVTKLAEEEDHHPEIIIEWGKVTVSWWSHKIKGLHMNDFICAAKTDELLK